MASTTCGHCGRLTHMDAASGLHITQERFHGTRTAMLEAVYKCPNCKRLNPAMERRSCGSEDGVSSPDGANNHDWADPTWIPVCGEVREFADVPEHIAVAATEATFCLSVGAFRAAGALARAVVEATAKDKKITTGKLADKTDALAAAGHVREHTKEQAHEVRHFGNDMAHGDFVDQVEKEDAEEVIELMAEVLVEVYQSPARLSARKAARLAKKNAET
jgi:ribosomal protein L21